MEVTTPSHASWVFDRDSAAAPPDPTGWKPVQLVPENARAGRGGLPVAVRPSENQAIWVEIYIDRTRHPGRYRGNLEVQADRVRRVVPIELEVFDFALPDENSMHAMLYYSAISRSCITDATSTPPTIVLPTAIASSSCRPTTSRRCRPSWVGFPGQTSRATAATTDPEPEWET